MWNIQLIDDDISLSSKDFAGRQIIETHIYRIYNNIEHITGEDYKTLKGCLEQHIVAYINAMTASAVELYVYNYGIDNAIPLLNNYNHNNHINTSSKSLLFAIFSNRFSIFYIPPVQHYQHTSSSPKSSRRFIHSILTIQRFWRRVLKVKKEVIENEISYLIVKIKKEIVGESVQKVLLYMVNKFRKRISNTLRL